MINTTYSDFSVDFLKNNFTNDLARAIDRTSIRQSLSNILLTMKGEKPFKRNFGCDIHKFLFENIDSSGRGFSSIQSLKLQRDITSQIDAFEPRVELVNILFDAEDIDSNVLKITVTYNILTMDVSDGFAQDIVSVIIAKVR